MLSVEKRSIKRQRRCIENIAEWTKVKINEVVYRLLKPDTHNIMLLTANPHRTILEDNNHVLFVGRRSKVKGQLLTNCYHNGRGQLSCAFNIITCHVM